MRSLLIAICVAAAFAIWANGARAEDWANAVQPPSIALPFDAISLSVRDAAEPAGVGIF